MTFDSRKVLVRQEIVEKIAIHLDGCRYATPEMLANRDVVFDGTTALPGSGHTDFIIIISTGTCSGYADDPFYCRLSNGEIIALQRIMFSDNTATVKARAQFGTTQVAHSGTISGRLMHLGEADGSCYGFPQTCSSADSYNSTVKRTLTFSTAPLECGAIYTNGLDRNSIRREGPEVHPGKDIGTRARLTFTIDDEDDEIDQLNPYRDRICADGQKLAKVLERCPYWDNRKCEHSEGLRDAGTFDEPDYQTRSYVIDGYNLDNGQLKVSCLDPLILTEDKKSKTPPASEGKLSAAITGTPSTFAYTGAEDYHYGPNASTTYVRIDSEVIKCTVTGVKTLTVTTRGYRSESKDHSAGATIQLCDAFPNDGSADMHVIDAIVWILENRTTVPAEYIDDYSAIITNTPSLKVTSALLTKPGASADRINDLIRIGNLIFYFDEITQKIVIDYIPELQIEPISLDDVNHISKESITVDRNQKQQFTRFTYSWAPYDVTKDSDEYFQFVHTGINLTLESATYMGAPNERTAEKTVFLSDDSGDSLLGVSYVARMLDQSAELPKILTLKLDAESVGETQGGTIAPGKIISIQTQPLINKTGTSIAKLFQVERISGTLSTGYTLKARTYVTVDPSSVDFTIDIGTYTDFDLSTVYAPAAGNYTVFIDKLCIFGSTNTSTPAFTTGTQSPGVSFHFIHRGQMLGTGGMGGDGADISLASTDYSGYVSDSGSPGLDGGPAFEATVDCTIDCGSGVIWSGGGGQGGQSSTALYDGTPAFTSALAGDGGGGGRGYSVSLGGAGGTASDGTLTDTGDTGSSGGQSTSAGGDWGQDGTLSVPNAWHEHGRAIGGSAGAAIITNSNTVTITAGNNPTNIKGRRI